MDCSCADGAQEDVAAFLYVTNVKDARVSAEAWLQRLHERRDLPPRQEHAQKPLLAQHAVHLSLPIRIISRAWRHQYYSLCKPRCKLRPDAGGLMGSAVTCFWQADSSLLKPCSKQNLLLLGICFITLTAMTNNVSAC